ncbi:MAG TPA: 2'-5' RNA ligase family protein [Solirubrobacteraceae bacterium]|nr:2'-5' RNA ligase family protein [Solirubrobacteraceae bacterium]
MEDPRSSRRAPFRPPLFYRITGRLNVVVWRLPLPRRVLARISMVVYRNPPMPGEGVVEVVQALQSAGVGCWVSGGWGVDALAGAFSRVHRDLDLVFDERRWTQAVEALATLGYSEWYSVDSDRPTFSRVVVRDHPVAGRVVDAHPIDVAAGHLEFDTGSIDGHKVPCLSVESQVKTHSNYRKRWRDRTDLSTLHKLVEGASTALIVPVQAASGLLEDSAREVGMPAHVTLVHPFLRMRRIGSETERELASLLGAFPAFDFTLEEARNFPKVLYLAPVPAAPFVDLVQAFAARWPEQQPYGGAFDEIVPHVTIGYRDDIPVELAARLPMRARAEEVWLMSRVGQRWVTRRRFGLAGTGGQPGESRQSSAAGAASRAVESPTEERPSIHE